jgi:hypothetical protein
MSKVAWGFGLGAVLGLLDGLSALFYPEARPMIVQIVVGSIAKGVVTGLAMGLIARKTRSVLLGLAGGAAVGLVLSFAAAAVSSDAAGDHHYVQIMLPGAVLGLDVGYATQRLGAAPSVGGSPS